MRQDGNRRATNQLLGKWKGHTHTHTETLKNQQQQQQQQQQVSNFDDFLLLMELLSDFCESAAVAQDPGSEWIEGLEAGS